MPNVPWLGGAGGGLASRFAPNFLGKVRARFNSDQFDLMGLKERLIKELTGAAQTANPYGDDVTGRAAANANRGAGAAGARGPSDPEWEGPFGAGRYRTQSGGGRPGLDVTGGVNPVYDPNGNFWRWDINPRTGEASGSGGEKTDEEKRYLPGGPEYDPLKPLYWWLG